MDKTFNLWICFQFSLCRCFLCVNNVFAMWLWICKGSIYIHNIFKTFKQIFDINVCLLLKWVIIANCMCLMQDWIWLIHDASSVTGMSFFLWCFRKRRYHSRRIHRDVIKKRTLIGDDVGLTPPYKHRHSGNSCQCRPSKNTTGEWSAGKDLKQCLM